MKHLAAYLLAKMGGKNEPAVADIEKIIAAVGGTTDADLAKTVVEKVGAGGLSVEDLMSLGKKRMASMPAVGAACRCINRCSSRRSSPCSSQEGGV